MFSEEIIQRVKSENNIVDVISETVPLKRAGRNYLGRCPFHSEKTPSFTVSGDKQIYKCFGCGEAGNVISFIMKTRNLTFPEAVKVLADRAGIELEENEDGHSASREKYKRMFELNVQAARYFYSGLKRNDIPREYLLKRGITDETIKKFGLGYAPEGWQNLRNYLKKLGFSEGEVLELGLTIKNEKDNIYDRFRNRIIFPVFDVSGRVIGFGGRVLDDSKPKYLNSPETPIFHKGTNLYGLNLAIKNSHSNSVIMVEGYMDTISLHQSGITNVVATLGTALTEGQCKLLKRYYDTVIVSFDSDAAGQKATVRSLDILKKVGLSLKILQIPMGKDPDEYIRSHGKEEFESVVRNALPIVDYQLKMAEKGINFGSKEMKVRYLKSVKPILEGLDPMERAVYVKQVAERAQVPENAILDSIGRDMRKAVKSDNNNNINNENGQKLYLEPAFIKASRNVLKLALDSRISEKIFTKVEEEDFPIKAHRIIFSIIKQNHDMPLEDLKEHIEMKTIEDSSLTSEWVKIQEEIGVAEQSSVDKMVSDCIKELKKYKLEGSMKEIMNKIKVCEEKGLIEESLSLAVELIEIRKKIESL